MGMIRANIGDEKYAKIKESWKYFYVFHALRLINNPEQAEQIRLDHLIPIKNKRDADNFARNPKVANYTRAKLIHDPILQRSMDKQEAINNEIKEAAIVKAKEAAVKAKPIVKKVVKKRTNKKK